MYSIFNSLGSNYSLKFITTALWSIFFSKKRDLLDLESYLAQTYGGRACTVYKGRDAIEVALTTLLKKDSQVLTQAFSCYAIEEGILRAGMQPVYVDIGPDSTNLTVATLDQALKKNPKAQAVIIQHSLGIPAQSIAIADWCRKHGLLLLEDLAQGVGGVSQDGTLLGTYADAVIFSFGKDKILDAVAGGAVVFKSLDTVGNDRLNQLEKSITTTSFHIVYADLLYPDITSFIRKTHHLGLGKVVFKVCKALGLLGSPIQSSTSSITRMHPAYAKLVLLQIKDLQTQLSNRKKRAQEYLEQLTHGPVTCLIDESVLQCASNLRFSIRCRDLDHVGELVTALKRHRIYVSDRWYRSAVDCGSFACKTAYQKASCPHAELLATQILNLPTHRAMTTKTVQKICKIILEHS